MILYDILGGHLALLLELSFLLLILFDLVFSAFAFPFVTMVFLYLYCVALFFLSIFTCLQVIVCAL